MSFYIQKYSGEKELFDIKKFSRSLQRAGASRALIDQLVREIEDLPALRTTKEIYKFALARLHQQSPATAARYNIKQAILALGPSGFPFEKYIAALFRAQGYATEVGTTAQGFCITHELDVVATRKNQQLMIECKFHQQGIVCDVKVPLYIKARFDDVAKAWKTAAHNHEFHEAVIVTNTRFSADAIAYAHCIGIQLIGWSYPHNAGLETLVDKFSLHPITALVTLTNQQKRVLIDQGLILCRDAEQQRAALNALGLSEQDKEHLMQEMRAVCSITQQYSPSE